MTKGQSIEDYLLWTLVNYKDPRMNEDTSHEEIARVMQPEGGKR